MAKQHNEMTDRELTKLIRSVVDQADRCGPENVSAAVQPLRDAGIVCGPYRGARAKESARAVMILCDSCNGTRVTAICETRKCRSEHNCQPEDYYDAWQDAWGMWWSPCAECKLTARQEPDTFVL